MKKILRIVAIAFCLLLTCNLTYAQAPTVQYGPTDNYGFLNAPDGSTWTYIASFTKQYGYYTCVNVEVYNSQNKLVGRIVDSLKIDDANLIGINQAEINPLVTQKFFNTDNSYEVMLFLHGVTKDYEGLYFNHVFSLSSTKVSKTPVAVIDGRQVYAHNIGEFTENYVMIFARDSAKNDDYTLCYDVRKKSTFGGGVYRTFRVPYANVGGLTDLQPFFMLNRGGNLNYVLQQYEKPYFDNSVSNTEEPVVTPDNNLVITYLNEVFQTVSVTKIPIVQDANTQMLYTFPALGALNGVNDIIWDKNGALTYVITQEKYDLSSDESVCSFYLYDKNGQKLKTIVEDTKGRIKMSPIAGEEEQWLFMKEEYDGEFCFVNIPSCETTADISVYLNSKDVLSSAIDRYPKGDSYEYAVALLQGDNEADGSVAQRIAWLNADGTLNRYEKINMGKYIESAQLNISADVLNPRLMNTDDAREYMVLVKRYNPDNTTDKETALLICNTRGEILLDYGKDEQLGGDLNMVYMFSNTSSPTMLCVYADGDKLTLNYTPMPLNESVSLQGSGTAEDPYKIASAVEFEMINSYPSKAYFEIVKDIDFMSIPMKSVNRAFSGVLDGKGHVLKNLCLVDGGIFREVIDSAKIMNISLERPTLVLTEECMTPAGIIANTMRGGIDDAGTTTASILTNIHISNPTIKGVGYTESVGGLVGAASLFLDVNTCSVSNAIYRSPSANVGGLIGKAATSSSISACLFTGAIEAGKVAGGIVSEIDSAEPVYNCRVDADITGANTIGGIVGYSARALVSNCVVDGSLSLNATAKVGRVGGVLGELETFISADTIDVALENCLVNLSAISIPESKDIVAHRIVGFSSVDDFEYDWDSIDVEDESVPQSEWPRLYYHAERGLRGNYVVSDLLPFDTSIALTDTTTEGATKSWDAITVEWLNEHQFQLGDSVSAPWVIDNKLKLWFEADIIGSGVEDIVGNIGGIQMVGDQVEADGWIEIYNLSGMCVGKGRNKASISRLISGVYVIRVSNGTSARATKLLVP